MKKFKRLFIIILTVIIAFFLVSKIAEKIYPLGHKEYVSMYSEKYGVPEMLVYGKDYQLVEVQAPYGYVLDDTPIYFDITEENATQEGALTLTKVEKKNQAQKGKIIVTKEGENFVGVNVSGDETKIGFTVGYGNGIQLQRIQNSFGIAVTEIACHRATQGRRHINSCKSCF